MLRHHQRLKKARILAQFLFLLIGGFAATWFQPEILVLSSPLLAFLAAIAGLVVLMSLVGAVVLIASAVAGRFFCGWICPLGCLQQAFAFLGQSLGNRKPRKVSSFLYFKYLPALGLVVGTVFGLSWAAGFDPIALFFQGFAATRRLIGLSGGEGRAIDSGTALVLLFLGSVLLTSVGLPRAWCRYLCPLGATLGASARMSRVPITRTQACTRCGDCSRVCQHACIDDRLWIRSECNYCMNCLAICPEDALHLTRVRALGSVRSGPDLSRRSLLASLGSGLLAAGLLRPGARGSRQRSSRLIRPPGSAPETQFTGRCVRCGACGDACPAGVIRPAVGEAGVQGLLTPRLDFTVGYCQLECNACSQACPTEAIEPFDAQLRAPSASRAPIIGLAEINRSRCLPWAFGKACILCSEFCPTSPKAILLEKTDETGLLRPLIEPDRCVGCGACEFVCPFPDAAVKVFAANESRHPENRVIL